MSRDIEVFGPNLWENGGHPGSTVIDAACSVTGHLELSSTTDPKLSVQIVEIRAMS
jgi:hypothetical protein